MNKALFVTILALPLLGGCFGFFKKDNNVVSQEAPVTATAEERTIPEEITPDLSEEAIVADELSDEK